MNFSYSSYTDTESLSSSRVQPYQSNEYNRSCPECFRRLTSIEAKRNLARHFFQGVLLKKLFFHRRRAGQPYRSTRYELESSEEPSLCTRFPELGCNCIDTRTIPLSPVPSRLGGYLDSWSDRFRPPRARYPQTPPTQSNRKRSRIWAAYRPGLVPRKPLALPHEQRKVYAQYDPYTQVEVSRKRTYKGYMPPDSDPPKRGLSKLFSTKRSVREEETSDEQEDTTQRAFIRGYDTDDEAYETGRETDIDTDSEGARKLPSGKEQYDFYPDKQDLPGPSRIRKPDTVAESRKKTSELFEISESREVLPGPSQIRKPDKIGFKDSRKKTTEYSKITETRKDLPGPSQTKNPDEVGFKESRKGTSEFFEISETRKDLPSPSQIRTPDEVAYKESRKKTREFSETAETRKDLPGPSRIRKPDEVSEFRKKTSEFIDISEARKELPRLSQSRKKTSASSEITEIGKDVPGPSQIRKPDEVKESRKKISEVSEPSETRKDLTRPSQIRKPDEVAELREKTSEFIEISEARKDLTRPSQSGKKTSESSEVFEIRKHLPEPSQIRKSDEVAVKESRKRTKESSEISATQEDLPGPSQIRKSDEVRFKSRKKTSELSEISETKRDLPGPSEIKKTDEVAFKESRKKTTEASKVSKTRKDLPGPSQIRTPDEVKESGKKIREVSEPSETRKDLPGPTQIRKPEKVAESRKKTSEFSEITESGKDIFLEKTYREIEKGGPKIPPEQQDGTERELSTQFDLDRKPPGKKERESISQARKSKQFPPTETPISREKETKEDLRKITDEHVSKQQDTSEESQDERREVTLKRKNYGETVEEEDESTIDEKTVRRKPEPKGKASPELPLKIEKSRRITSIELPREDEDTKDVGVMPKIGTTVEEEKTLAMEKTTERKKYEIKKEIPVDKPKRPDPLGLEAATKIVLSEESVPSYKDKVEKFPESSEKKEIEIRQETREIVEEEKQTTKRQKVLPKKTETREKISPVRSVVPKTTSPEVSPRGSILSDKRKSKSLPRPAEGKSSLEVQKMEKSRRITSDVVPKEEDGRKGLGMTPKTARTVEEETPSSVMEKTTKIAADKPKRQELLGLEPAIEVVWPEQSVPSPKDKIHKSPERGEKKDIEIRQKTRETVEEEKQITTSQKVHPKKLETGPNISPVISEVQKNASPQVSPESSILSEKRKSQTLPKSIEAKGSPEFLKIEKSRRITSEVVPKVEEEKPISDTQKTTERGKYEIKKEITPDKAQAQEPLDLELAREVVLSEESAPSPRGKVDSFPGRGKESSILPEKRKSQTLPKSIEAKGSPEFLKIEKSRRITSEVVPKVEEDTKGLTVKSKSAAEDEKPTSVTQKTTERGKYEIKKEITPDKAQAQGPLDLEPAREVVLSEESAPSPRGKVDTFPGRGKETRDIVVEKKKLTTSQKVLPPEVSTRGSILSEKIKSQSLPRPDASPKAKAPADKNPSQKERLDKDSLDKEGKTFKKKDELKEEPYEVSKKEPEVKQIPEALREEDRDEVIAKARKIDQIPPPTETSEPLVTFDKDKHLPTRELPTRDVSGWQPELVDSEEEVDSKNITRTKEAARELKKDARPPKKTITQRETVAKEKRVDKRVVTRKADKTKDEDFETRAEISPEESVEDVKRKPPKPELRSRKEVQDVTTEIEVSKRGEKGKPSEKLAEPTPKEVQHQVKQKPPQQELSLRKEVQELTTKTEVSKREDKGKPPEKSPEPSPKEVQREVKKDVLVPQAKEVTDRKVIPRKTELKYEDEHDTGKEMSPQESVQDVKQRPVRPELISRTKTQEDTSKREDVSKQVRSPGKVSARSPSEEVRTQGLTPPTIDKEKTQKKKGIEEKREVTKITALEVDDLPRKYSQTKEVTGRKVIPREAELKDEDEYETGREMSPQESVQDVKQRPVRPELISRTKTQEDTSKREDVPKQVRSPGKVSARSPSEEVRAQGLIPRTIDKQKTQKMKGIEEKREVTKITASEVEDLPRKYSQTKVTDRKVIPRKAELKDKDEYETGSEMSPQESVQDEKQRPARLELISRTKSQEDTSKREDVSKQVRSPGKVSARSPSEEVRTQGLIPPAIDTEKTQKKKGIEEKREVTKITASEVEDLPPKYSQVKESTGKSGLKDPERVISKTQKVEKYELPAGERKITASKVEDLPRKHPEVKELPEKPSSKVPEKTISRTRKVEKYDLPDPEKKGKIPPLDKISEKITKSQMEVTPSKGEVKTDRTIDKRTEKLKKERRPTSEVIKENKTSKTRTVESAPIDNQEKVEKDLRRPSEAVKETKISKKRTEESSPFDDQARVLEDEIQKSQPESVTEEIAPRQLRQVKKTLSKEKVDTKRKNSPEGSVTDYSAPDKRKKSKEEIEPAGKIPISKVPEQPDKTNDSQKVDEVKTLKKIPSEIFQMQDPEKVTPFPLEWTTKPEELVSPQKAPESSAKDKIAQEPQKLVDVAKKEASPVGSIYKKVTSEIQGDQIRESKTKQEKAGVVSRKGKVVPETQEPSKDRGIEKKPQRPEEVPQKEDVIRQKTFGTVSPDRSIRLSQEEDKKRLFKKKEVSPPSGTVSPPRRDDTPDQIEREKGVQERRARKDGREKFVHDQQFLAKMGTPPLEQVPSQTGFSPKGTMFSQERSERESMEARKLKKPVKASGKVKKEDTEKEMEPQRIDIYDKGISEGQGLKAADKIDKVEKERPSKGKERRPSSEDLRDTSGTEEASLKRVTPVVPKGRFYKDGRDVKFDSEAIEKKDREGGESSRPKVDPPEKSWFFKFASKLKTKVPVAEGVVTPEGVITADGKLLPGATVAPDGTVYSHDGKAIAVVGKDGRVIGDGGEPQLTTWRDIKKRDSAGSTSDPVQDLIDEGGMNLGAFGRKQVDHKPVKKKRPKSPRVSSPKRTSIQIPSSVGEPGEEVDKLLWRTGPGYDFLARFGHGLTLDEILLALLRVTPIDPEVWALLDIDKQKQRDNVKNYGKPEGGPKAVIDGVHNSLLGPTIEETLLSLCSAVCRQCFLGEGNPLPIYDVERSKTRIPKSLDTYSLHPKTTNPFEHEKLLEKIATQLQKTRDEKQYYYSAPPKKRYAPKYQSVTSITTADSVYEFPKVQPIENFRTAPPVYHTIAYTRNYPSKSVKKSHATSKIPSAPNYFSNVVPTLRENEIDNRRSSRRIPFKPSEPSVHKQRIDNLFRHHLQSQVSYTTSEDSRNLVAPFRLSDIEWAQT